jgi:DNA-binding NtrC family response regulator
MTTILVVDDDPGILDLYSLVIREGLGVEVVTAECAEVAMQLVATSCVNVVLSDVDMPGMSGIALAQEVKVVCPDIFIILMSARSEPEGHVADAFLQKPFHNNQVVLIIRALIG